MLAPPRQQRHLPANTEYMPYQLEETVNTTKGGYKGRYDLHLEQPSEPELDRGRGASKVVEPSKRVRSAL